MKKLKIKKSQDIILFYNSKKKDTLANLLIPFF
jgi:hypothetical protein